MPSSSNMVILIICYSKQIFRLRKSSLAKFKKLMKYRTFNSFLDNEDFKSLKNMTNSTPFDTHFKFYRFLHYQITFKISHLITLLD